MNNLRPHNSKYFRYSKDLDIKTHSCTRHLTCNKKYHTRPLQSDWLPFSEDLKEFHYVKSTDHFCAYFMLLLHFSVPHTKYIMFHVHKTLYNSIYLCIFL